MIRLTKLETPTEARLILEGSLAGPYAAAVSANWKELRHDHPDRKFVVDLRGVTRVDCDGESVLLLMKREGATFLATGLRVKQLLKDLKTRARNTKSQSGRPVLCMNSKVEPPSP
jgi:anti-anti-sigma regulatory factor